MRKRDIRRLQMLEHVRDFGATHRDVFPQASFAGRMFAVVADAVEALKHHAAKELAGRNDVRAGTESKEKTRMTLRRRLSAVSRFARVVAVDMPGFDAAFRVRFDCSDERLLARARSLLKAARPLAQTFVDHDMPLNLLAKLQEDVDAFDTAIASREHSHGRRTTARTGIDAEIRKGLLAAKRLDAIVPHKIEDRGALAIWNAGRRVGYPRRSKKPVAA